MQHLSSNRFCFLYLKMLFLLSFPCFQFFSEPLGCIMQFSFKQMEIKKYRETWAPERRELLNSSLPYSSIRKSKCAVVDRWHWSFIYASSIKKEFGHKCRKVTYVKVGQILLILAHSALSFHCAIIFFWFYLSY